MHSAEQVITCRKLVEPAHRLSSVIPNHCLLSNPLVLRYLHRLAMTAATVARSSLNSLQQNANGDIWLRLVLEDHYQIPFQGVRPACQSRERNTGSPMNF